MTDAQWTVGQRVAVNTHRGTVPCQRVVLKVTKLHVIVGKAGDDPKLGSKYRHHGRSVHGDTWSFTTIVPWTDEHTRMARQAAAKHEAEELAVTLRNYTLDVDAADINPIVVERLREAVALLPAKETP